MRFAVLVLALLGAGCNLIFPLEGPPDAGIGQDADPFQDANPNAPSVSNLVFTPPPIVGKTSVLLGDLAGTPNATVHERLFATANAGSFENPDGINTLGGFGTGSLTELWNPPSVFGRGSIQVELSYDSTFANRNSFVQPVDVLQHFGEVDKLGQFVRVFPDVLVAVQVAIPADGSLREIGIIGVGGKALVGIYEDVSDAPGALKATSAAFNLTGMPQELPFNVALPAGTYWIAMLFEGTSDIAGVLAAASLPVRQAGSMFVKGLPVTFPLSSPGGSTYNLYLTVGP